MEETIGVAIVKKALEAPIRQIALNAGDEGAIIIERVLAQKDPNMGYDANDGQIKDLVKQGVIDPTKVARIALENAASIAGMLLTTECVLADEPEPELPMPAGGPGGMGGMGGGMPMM